MDLNDSLFNYEYSVVEFDEEGNRSVLKTLSTKVSTKGGLHGPETGALIPVRVTADRQGNFYIAGICRLDSESEVQTVTSMFSHSGNQLWKYVSHRSVDAEELESDWMPDALVVDNVANVYLADWFEDVPESTAQDAVWPLKLRISKCNSRGVNEWTYENKKDKKGLFLLRPVLLKVQDSGNVLCISLVQGPGGGGNLHVLALASNGEKVFDGLVSRPSDWPKIFIKR